MPCCAVADCGNPECPVCSVPRRFPPIETCAKETTTGPCVLVKNHPRWVSCRAEWHAEKVDTSTRDGDPKLAAERKRSDLAFQKRHRAGPQWVPHHRRV